MPRRLEADLIRPGGNRLDSETPRRENVCTRWKPRGTALGDNGQLQFTVIGNHSDKCLMLWPGVPANDNSGEKTWIKRNDRGGIKPVDHPNLLFLAPSSSLVEEEFQSDFRIGDVERYLISISHVERWAKRGLVTKLQAVTSMVRCVFFPKVRIAPSFGQGKYAECFEPPVKGRSESTHDRVYAEPRRVERKYCCFPSLSPCI